MKDLDVEALKEFLAYSPDTGLFRWLKRTGKTGPDRTGQIAGSKDFEGYIVIKVNQKIYRAHRLAWAFVTGKPPSDEIDHIDGNPSNNVWKNLREATSAENLRNRGMHRRNKSGFKGATLIRDPNRKKKYRASIRVDGKSIFLGNYMTAQEAHQAYCEAAKIYHGYFANSGT